MTERLPTLGETPYKTILDGFLLVAHNADGTLKTITYSQLNLALGIVNGDIAAAAAIAPSKLAGYPTDATKFLSGAGTWIAASSVTYRKTTAKTVNTTVAATDLLNAEITLAALAATSVVRLTAWGDWLQNSGGTAAPPRFQAVLGGTTLLDTGTGGTVTAAATRFGWRVTVEITNLGATNSQMSNMTVSLAETVTGATNNVFTTGEGIYKGAGGGAGNDLLLGVGTNPATAVDTSTAKALVLNVINGSANAAYETKLLGALVEII